MTVVADQTRVEQLVNSLIGWTEQIMAQSGPWALVGLKSRGDVLADRVAAALGTGRFAGRVGSLDITLYRDDLSEIGPCPVVRTTDIDFDIDRLNLILVDDVLMSGRTIRAALASLMDMGRPRRIWLAVLVDRGGRELPICPDFTALDLRDHQGQDRVKLTIRPIHERDEILTVPLA